MFFFLLLINYFDNVITKFIVNNKTDALKSDVKLKGFMQGGHLSNFGRNSFFAGSS